MAHWLAGDELSADQFRLALSRLEDGKLKRFGLKLSSSVSDQKIVHFTLRFVEKNEFCASIDVDPVSGAMTVQRAED